MSSSLFPIAQTAPAIVTAPSNVRGEQESQSQHGPLPSESQPSQYDNRGAPSNEQRHAVPNTTAGEEIPSAERPSSTGPSSQLHVRPLTGYLVTTVDAEGITEQRISLNLNLANFRPGVVPNLGHDPPPPPYEPKAPQRVSSTQEGTSSRPSMGISREVRNESTTTSGNISSIFSSPPLGSNFRQGNTSNGSTSSPMTLDILPGNSQNPRMEIPTRAVGETITSQPSRLTVCPPLDNSTERAKIYAQASPLERDGGQSTRARPRPSQAVPPTSTTPGTPLGLDRTVSVASRSPGRHQQLPQPSHTDNDTLHLRPSTEHRPAPSRDVPSRLDRSTPRVNDTRASQETLQPPSESRLDLNTPPPPPPALSSLRSYSRGDLLDSRSSTTASRVPPTNIQNVQRHHSPLRSQSHRIVAEQPSPQPSLEVRRPNQADSESATQAARRTATVEAKDPQPGWGKRLRKICCCDEQ